jgi:hypothetical protein
VDTYTASVTIEFDVEAEDVEQVAKEIIRFQLYLSEIDQKFEAPHAWDFADYGKFKFKNSEGWSFEEEVQPQTLREVLDEVAL